MIRKVAARWFNTLACRLCGQLGVAIEVQEKTEPKDYSVGHYSEVHAKEAYCL